MHMSDCDNQLTPPPVRPVSLPQSLRDWDGRRPGSSQDPRCRLEGHRLRLKFFMALPQVGPQASTPLTPEAEGTPPHITPDKLQSLTQYSRVGLSLIG